MRSIILITLFLVVLALPVAVGANHSWGGYHWSRALNPFTLKLGDNVFSNWDPYLGMTSNDWSVSTVLDTVIVPGQSKGNCQPTAGRVEVCNKTYGRNGWLGMASIWVSGSHIKQGTVKVNDTYFNTAYYNTPAWRQFVMCQEVGHTFGLDHQDVNFTNANLGTCMDYTNDPDGTLYSQLDNQRPNAHDYDQLGIIYEHLDALATSFGKKSLAPASVSDDDIDTLNPAEWGKVIRSDSKGRPSLYERDLGRGEKMFTFVIWAN